MRKIFSVILIAVSLQAVAQQHLEFIDQDWNQALARAAAENKYIVLDAFTDWCGWCKVMERNTFTDSNVITYYTAHFVPVRVDMEKGTGVDLAMKYRVSAFPSILYFDKDGKLVYRTVGYRQVEDFIADGRAALDATQQFDHPGDPKTLDPGFPDFYKKSFLKGKEREWPSQETVDGFLAGRTDPYSELSWAIMSRFNLDDPYLGFFLQHMEQYREYYGATEVDRKYNTILSSYARSAVKTKDSTLFVKCLDIIHTYSAPADTAMLAAGYRIYYYEQMQLWDRYTAEVLKHIKTSPQLASWNYNDYAWKIYQHVDDPEIIKKAIGWMEDVVTREPEYQYLDTYAALLFKSGQLEKAEEIALRAIETGTANNKDVKSSQELLEKIRAAEKE